MIKEMSNTKFTDEQAKVIKKKLIDLDLTYRELGQLIGISTSSICSIISGSTSSVRVRNLLSERLGLPELRYKAPWIKYSVQLFYEPKIVHIANKLDIYISAVSDLWTKLMCFAHESLIERTITDFDFEKTQTYTGLTISEIKAILQEFAVKKMIELSEVDGKTTVRLISDLYLD